MTSALPPSWSTTNLECGLEFIKNGIAEKQNKENKGLPVTRIETIADGNINLTKIGYVDWNTEKKDAAGFLLANGDILFSHINSPSHLGKTALYRETEGPLYHGTNLLRIRPNQEVCEPRFLNYQFRLLRAAGEFSQIAQHAVNQASINQAKLKKLQIILAPIDEQKRIADKLDVLLGRVVACRERLERVPTILKRFRQSVLAAATSGKLTEDWREHSNSIWRQVKIGDVCASSFYGPRFGKGEYTSDGIPTIRTTDMTPYGEIKLTSETPRVAVSPDKLANCQVKKGDLLVTRTGSIGTMAVFNESYTAIPSAYLIRFRFSTEILSKYAFYCLTSPDGRDKLGLSSTAITQPNINAEAIKRIEINLPPMNEQLEIISRVDKLFELIDQMETRFNKCSQQVKQLTPSILSKAFSGALLPQEPTDKPAVSKTKKFAVNTTQRKLSKTSK